ncbi:MAG: hypothetical protein KAX25_06405, partial [Dehalococcoidia bacterium]|nr:hypothetical protein [Dehalococcoidia bacterium]
ASLGGDLTGIDVVDDGGPKLKLTWTSGGGGSVQYDAAAIQSKLTEAANSLVGQANDYLSTGYGDPDGRWWLRVSIASGKLTFAAQFKLLGITAAITGMDISFTDLTASFTDATVSVGTSTKQTTFSGTADISCTNYVPSLTVTSLSVGDEYPGFRDYIADSGVNSALRDALDDLVDSLVTDTGLTCRLATFDHIEITGANTLRIWLEEREIQIPLKAGWNMVSVPVIPADTSVSSVFPGAEVVYTWDPITRSYYVPTDVEPEKGYWVAVIADTNITMTGVIVSTWTSSLTAGWNMIGSIYGKDVDFTDPYDNPDGSVQGFAYWWDPSTRSYALTYTLESKKGYWAAATQNCQLTLS